MKNLLLITIMLLSKTAYAQCNGQNKYDANWIMNYKNISLTVQLKDKRPFNYYHFFNGGFKFIELPYKINTSISIKLPDLSYDSYGPFLYKEGNEKRVQELFYPYNSISDASNGIMRSDIYSFPLSDERKQTKAVYIRKFEYSTIIKDYKNLFEYNNLYGKHKVKFYVNLIETPDLKECALFESPVVELNLGRKPFSKIWKEIFE